MSLIKPDVTTMAFLKSRLAALGSLHRDIAVPDDATQEQIEAEAKEAAFDFVQWHFEEVK